MHATASPRVDSMLGTLSASIAKGRLPLWIYNDPEVFRLEMERVFARNWIFVAHTLCFVWRLPCWPRPCIGPGHILQTRPDKPRCC